MGVDTKIRGGDNTELQRLMQQVVANQKEMQAKFDEIKEIVENQQQSTKEKLESLEKAISEIKVSDEESDKPLSDGERATFEAILEIVASGEWGATSAQICEKTGKSESVASRYLTGLKQKRYVRPYRVGRLLQYRPLKETN